MPNDALSRFAEIIIHQATENKNQNIERQAQKNSAELRAGKAEIKQRSLDEMNRAAMGIKSRTAKRLAAVENEYRVNLLKRRNQICEEVFSEAKARLAEFVVSEEYAGWFGRTLSEACAEINAPDTVCTVSERDKKLIPPHIAIEVTNDDIIGGFTLRSDSEKLFCDCTLAARLQAQREHFYASSGLTIGS